MRRILDVGCATGLVLHEIQRRLGVDVIGVDINPHPCIAAPVPILQANALRDPLPLAGVAFSMHLGHRLRERDALIIGGGPAGLSAAIAIRLNGCDVTVVDAAHPPIDKACGEGIPPAGVEILQRLGLRLSGDAFPLRGIRFLDNGTSVPVQCRTRRDDGLTPLAPRISRPHRLSRRCVGLSGRHYRRRLEPLVSPGRRPLRRAMSRRSRILYQSEHSRLARRPAFVAATLLSLDRFPALAAPFQSPRSRSPNPREASHSANRR